MTAEHRTTPPPFDPQLTEVFRSMGVQALAVGMTDDGVGAARESMGRLTPSFEELAADPRYRFSRRSVPGLPANPPVDVLLALPVDSPAPGPLLFTTHGGGLISGTHITGLPGVLDAAADIGATVISVDYRLAPEHPFPAAHEDAYAALLWAADNAASIGVDPDRIVLYGGSAGGNLAAGLALRARDSGEVRLRGQVLLYPMLDDRSATLSSRQMRGLGIWDDVTNRTAWDCVLGSPRDEPPSPYAVPARAADLSGLPPTYLEVGSAETFRDETIEFAHRLWQHGGDAELHVWAGAFHGFDLFAPGSIVSARARAARRDWLVRLATP
jgi:acetyl esterase/lipase